MTVASRSAANQGLTQAPRPLNGRGGLWINSDRIHRAGPNMAAVPGLHWSASFIPGLAWLRYDFVMNSIRLLAVLVAAALAWGAAPARAQQQRDADRPPPRMERPQRSEADARVRDNPRTMSESVRWAQRTTGGQVLGAERVQSDGHDFNRVKLIDDRGRVRYVDDVRQPRRQDYPPPPADASRRPPGR